MAILDKYLIPQYEAEDRWLAARNKTASYLGTPTERLIRWAVQSVPGLATQRVPQEILMTERGMGVDLNTYRPNVDVKMLADLGVQVFDLRLFCPGRWVYGNWNYYQDQTAEQYLNILVTIPGISIGMYGVYNPWLDEESNYTSPLDPNVEYMKLYVKNYIQYLAYVMWDVEVGTCTKGANTSNGITAPNLTKGLGNTMSQTLKQLPKLPQPDGQLFPCIPELYTATWFTRQYGEFMAKFLESGAPDSLNMQWIPWLAWYLQQAKDTYTKPSDYFATLPTPNGVQENAYLHNRSEVVALKWQVTSNLIGPWCKDGKGIDASLLYGIGAKFKDYCYYHNYTPSSSTTPPEPPLPPTTGEYLTVDAFNKWKADTYQTHTHTTLGPTL